MQHALRSADSQRSLALPGRVFGAAQPATFVAKPGAEEAVQLRLWDDRAPCADAPTPPLAHLLDRASRRTR